MGIVHLPLALAIGVTLLLVVAARAQPALPFALEATDAGVIVSSTGEAVTAIRTPGGEPFALEAFDLVEEPDVVETWAELDRFYTRQGELLQRLEGPVVEVEIDGAWRSVPVARRELPHLPLTFYTLLVASFATWIIGLATYALSDRGPAARNYAASAVAFSSAVWPAALYGARPLALDPEAFRWLATVDHFGGLLFGAGVVNMVAVYPVRLLRFTSWSWALAVAAGIAGHLQLGDKAIFGFYTTNTLQFLLFLGLSGLQWRACRRKPLERAAFGWIALSTFVGIIFFFLLITLPVLLRSRPVITQTTGFVSMVVMFAGISLGVLRFRLFDLDRWWFRTWSWIFGGMAVIGVDLLLTRTFQVADSVALVAAVIGVGWIYFPARQALLERLGRARKSSAAHDPAKIIGARTLAELEDAVRKGLTALFDPLEIVEAPGRLEGPRLAGDGAWLEVPSPSSDFLLRCHFRDGGARLFSREDVGRATELATLATLVRSAMEAREEGQTAERSRIRRDLHDDLGASIIRIAHEAQDERTAVLAKAAMRDLRDVLTTLQDAPLACGDALDELEADLRQRAQAAGRDVHWVVRGDATRVLSSRARANLTRALREATTNALKHGAGTVGLSFDARPDALQIEVENAVGTSPNGEPGLGLDNIAARMGELGGTSEAARLGNTFRLILTIPWGGEP